ncbi:MAG: nicotinate-nucleotide--dimethylbenzimidazole phosphoribosyltransferase [Candidatus Niameybacter stercoravium]|nr:nicotinate-nucleotide--dimethylbenzimidazole phosphoribosyltransferase [Candidatus Niameybacter stercoravium]
MNRENLKAYIEQIKPLNREVMAQMEQYLDGLTKPVGALGKLEALMIQLAGAAGTTKIKTKPKVTVIMCSDNGVCDAGVSSCPQEVTATVTYNFTRGITGMNRLSEFAKADIHIVDVGVKADFNHPLIHNRKVCYGTKNMAIEPAMTEQEALQAIAVGIEETEKLIEKGYEIFGTGEMGIGNTTTSAAITAAFLGEEVVKVTGKGSGALDTVYHNKVEAIETALKMHKPNVDDPIDVLAKVGGLDIAGLAGVYIAAARHGKLVVIDGFIAAAAALVAYKLAPITKAYMIASHLSKEEGMTLILRHIGLEPHFNLDMRLGEGSGCPILFNLLDMAQYTLLGMGTFEDAGVDKSNYMHIWK